MREPTTVEFEWHPGLGIDAAALARLRENFRRPRAPMGEARFMGEGRRMFSELQGDLATLPAERIACALDEIASGTVAFGPRSEWRDWYLYLLGQLLAPEVACRVRVPAGRLVTAFIALDRTMAQPPYRGFVHDALLTLGRLAMERDRWTASVDADAAPLHTHGERRTADGALGELSAVLVFCLRYVPPPGLQAWWQSVLRIDSPHWRARIMTWLVGAHGLLSGTVGWPGDLPESAWPSVEWDGAHWLKAEHRDAFGAPRRSAGGMLSEGACSQVLQQTRAHFTAEVWIEWLESIDRVPAVASESGGVACAFEALYVAGPALASGAASGGALECP